jgi:hypothetical protein
MRAIVTSVDFSDYLSLTLPRMKPFFKEVLVLTAQRDHATRDVAEENGVLAYCTDAFWADGARFAKYRAVEEALDVLERWGWLCLLDCDVLFPAGADFGPLEVGKLYTPLRRMADGPCFGPDPSCRTCRGTGMVETTGKDNRRYRTFAPCPEACGIVQPPPEEEWPGFPVHPNTAEWAGYCQLFHCDDPVLGPPPWFDTSFTHAGAADSFFQAKWRPEDKVRPPWECLHMGESGVNWCGRVQPYIGGGRPDGAAERLSELRRLIGLRRGRAGADRFAAEKVRPA